MAQTTFLGNNVNILNCSICNNWIGKHNCKNENIIFSEGATIIKTKCNHFYHKNCYKTIDNCNLCQEQLVIDSQINLHHSNWWIVDSFWNTNFGV